MDNPDFQSSFPRNQFLDQQGQFDPSRYNKRPDFSKQQQPGPRRAFSEIDTLSDASEKTGFTHPKFQPQAKKFQSPTFMDPNNLGQNHNFLSPGLNQTPNIMINNNPVNDNSPYSSQKFVAPYQGQSQQQYPSKSMNIFQSPSHSQIPPLYPQQNHQTKDYQPYKDLQQNIDNYGNEFQSYQQSGRNIQGSGEKIIDKKSQFNNTQNQFNIPPSPMRTLNNLQPNIASQSNLQQLQSASRVSKVPIPQELLSFDQDYFPQYTMFLLSDEDKNLTNFRERIQKEKNRVDQDFDNYKNEFNNLLDDLKVQMQQGVDEHFKAFIDKYKRFKNEVIEYKNIKLDIPLNTIQPPSKYDTTTASNSQLIKELEELRYKNQVSKVFQYIQEIQKENLQKILSTSQDILSQMSQSSHLYNSDAACNSLKDIKNIFAQNLQLKFEPMNQFVKAIFQAQEEKQNKSPSPFKQTQFLNQSPNVNIFNSQVNMDTSYQNPMSQQTPQREKTQTYKSYENFPQQQKFPSQQNFPTQNQQRNFSKPQPLVKQPQPNHSPVRQQQQQQPLLSSKQKGNQNIIVNKPVDSGRILMQLQKIIKTEHTDILLCFSIVSDSIVATGSRNGIIGLYNMYTGQHMGNLEGHTGSICAMTTISTFNQSLLVSAGDIGDSCVIVWDPQEKKMLRKLQGHSAAVVSLVSLDDGQTIISGSYDKDIIVWNYNNGNQIQKLSTHNSSVAVLALSKDKSRFISCGLDQIVNVWKINYKNVLNNTSFESCYLEKSIKNNSLVCSLNSLQSDVDSLVVGGRDGKIKIFNLSTGEIDKIYTVNLGPIVELLAIEGNDGNIVVLSCINKDKNLVATNLMDGNNTLIDVDEKLFVEFGCGIGPKLQFIGNDRVVMISQKQDKKELTVWNLQY